MGLILESCLTEWLAALLAVAAAFYYFATSTFGYWRDRGVPFIKPVPFFGNTLPVLMQHKSAAELFMDFYNSEEFKGSPYGGIFLTRRPILVARDPEFIKQILIKDFNSFSDRGLPFNEKTEPLSAHLFNLSGWRWRALRNKLSPTFTSGKMKMMFELMLECAEGLEKMLDPLAEKETALEMKEPLAQFTTDVIGSCAFGLQINSMTDPDNQFRAMGRKIFEPPRSAVFKRTLLTALPFLQRWLRFSIFTEDVSDFFMGVVADTVDFREKNGVSRNDFMQLLIDLKAKGTLLDSQDTQTAFNLDQEAGKEALDLTTDLLAAQAFIFFVAGFETSSTTMSFALHELAQNPDIQDRLAKEIEATVALHGGQITYDTVQDMKYLDMVISETLRKFPPVGNLFRQVTKPCPVADTNLVLSPRYRVFIPVLALHRDPLYYPEPDKFDPERFTAQEKAKRHPMVYMPFGEGPRNCIGARFGLMQTKVGLVTMLRRFSFHVCEQTVLPTKLDPRSFVSTIRGGTWLRIKRRRPTTA